MTPIIQQCRACCGELRQANDRRSSSIDLPVCNLIVTHTSDCWTQEAGIWLGRRGMFAPLPRSPALRAGFWILTENRGGAGFISGEPRPRAAVVPLPCLITIFAAIRVIAYKWTRILFRCWKERVPYDESKYLQALQRRNPQLWVASQQPPPPRSKKKAA